jgi:hypothetical protein
MVYLQTTYELCFVEAYFESCDFSHENTNIDVSVFMLDLRMINMSSECEYDPTVDKLINPLGLHYTYMLSGCELIDTENISLPSQNMKLGGE